MNKIAIIGLLVIALLLSSFPITQAQDRVGVTTSALNVRATPSASGTRLGQIPANTEVILQGRNESGAWILGQNREGSLRGWMSATYLTVGFSVMELPVMNETFTPQNTVNTTTSDPAPNSSTPSTPHTKSTVNLRTEPNLTCEVITALPGRTELVLEGRSSDNKWVYVHTTDGSLRGWVSARFVTATGVSIADLPVIEVQSTSSSTSSSQASFVPLETGQSTIWQANSGSDNVSGTCKLSALTMCSHMVAITLNSNGTISWRGQEPRAYTLRQRNGVFSFSGRNKRGNGRITLSLVFNSENSWSMTMTQVFDNDPECIHTFYYTASRSR